jgi:hypothetical protein
MNEKRILSRILLFFVSVSLPCSNFLLKYSFINIYRKIGRKLTISTKVRQSDHQSDSSRGFGVKISCVSCIKFNCHHRLLEWRLHFSSHHDWDVSVVSWERLWELRLQSEIIGAFIWVCLKSWEEEDIWREWHPLFLWYEKVSGSFSPKKVSVSLLQTWRWSLSNVVFIIVVCILVFCDSYSSLSSCLFWFSRSCCLQCLCLFHLVTVFSFLSWDHTDDDAINFCSMTSFQKEKSLSIFDQEKRLFCLSL